MRVITLEEHDAVPRIANCIDPPPSAVAAFLGPLRAALVDAARL